MGQHTRGETQAATQSAQRQGLDGQSELSDLRQEVQLLSRQRKESQRLQNRLQRIVNDLQRSRSEGNRGHALVKHRIAELQWESQSLDADGGASTSSSGSASP